MLGKNILLKSLTYLAVYSSMVRLLIGCFCNAK